MNSKKRNKNRQSKPPNPIPPQKQEVSESLSPADVINAEIENVVEERVPNLVSENVTAEIKGPEETPKKPKRNRGKKKKDDDKSDKDEEVKSDEQIVEPEIPPNQELLDETNIAPTARKKKNKSKKGKGPAQGEQVEEIKVEKDAQLDDGISQTQEQLITSKEEPDQEIKSPKKKNKKKKNRNDSERSEKAEEVTCTSEFQKLLSEDVKVETTAQPSTDDTSISEATVSEVEIAPLAHKPVDDNFEGTSQKDEGNKNKKKNKKDKKPNTVFDVPNVQEQTKSHKITPVENYDISSNTSETIREAGPNETSELHDVEEIMASCSTSDQNTIKNKAKIAKPVDKKQETKVDENVKKTDAEGKFERAEEVKVTQIEPIEETRSDVISSEDLDDVILIPLTDITPDWHEEVIIEEGNGPVIGCEDKHESIVLEPQCRNYEKNKNRKRSPKPPRNTEKIESSDITNVGPESESTTTLKEITEQKPAVKLDMKVEIKLEEKVDKQENKVINLDVRDGNKKRDKRKKSPKPSTHAESSPGVEILPTTSCAILKPDDIMEKLPEQADILFKGKQDDNLEINPEEKMPPVTSFGGAVVSSPLEPEDISEIQTEVQVEKKETEKDEIERVHTPDNVKRQKSKKSPKPSVDISLASGSKSSHKSKQSILNIEDIIIIQAEVVSEEKAHKADSFIACEDSTDQKETIKMEVKHESQKPKKSKKSPKPLQKDSAHEMKYNTENDRVLETHGEVQMPITPRPHDSKLSPEAVVLELETSKMDLMPSPSEVTPDFIDHPRCSSEHLDSNNNMVIQEIQHSGANLIVPVIIPETPFVQSTNISSLELVPSGIKVIDTESDNKLIEEKTDLKSKVLEVNQDMEELKMSIERSLAELTSLEKSDRDTEKNMETQNTENDNNNKNIEVNQEILTAESKPASGESVNMLFETKEDFKHIEVEVTTCQEPVCPARKDHKGKGKSKKKGKQESTTQSAPAQPSTSTGTEKSSHPRNKNQDGNKSENSSGNTQEKEKKQTTGTKENNDDDLRVHENVEKNNQEFEPIENFEDAMTSSVDDVNKTFEIIANEADSRLTETQNNPEINITAPQDDEKNSRQEKQNPVSQPKNLLGHPDIPVPSSRTDYKKEKNKPPNCRQAKVKIKDANQVEIEIPEKPKEGPTESKRKLLNFKKPDESICVTNQNEDYIYKYSFRKVFLQCACHVCKKDLKTTRVPCSYCNLVFYCNQKHKDEDYSQHQALCFAVSTIGHLKDQKFIYADSRNVTGHNYRLLRMQMIVSCEKVLKRRLAPWEQEALLYPRMCALPGCREWRQAKLLDCEGCGQISYCLEHPDHLPKSHSRWCKSYNLYRGLVKHQQTKGRLEPKLPTRVLELTPLPQNINEVLAAMYEEKIEMSDIEYAALTQLATAPLTALYCLQHRPIVTIGITKKTMTLHIVGAELQFEADVLNKWELFLLHLLPNVEELRVVLVGPDLNPSNLPLDLLGKIRYCDNCQSTKRRVVFGFQDKRTYHEFWASDDFTTPDLVCAFNPSIQRSSAYNGKDTWPATINCILKLKSPLAITSYNLSELTSDLLRIQECATVRYNILCPPRNNSFASVRPDRNFISDDETPLLFKNYCVTVVCGV